MVDSFLHGVQIVETEGGPRPIRTVGSAVIGLVGTAGRGPVNHPVLITSRREAVLTFGAAGAGFSIPEALDAIYDQGGATVVVVNLCDPAAPAHHSSAAPAGMAFGADGRIALPHGHLSEVTVAGPLTAPVTLLGMPGSAALPAGAAPTAVRSADGTVTYAADTDYAVAGNVVTRLPGGQIPIGARLTISYTKALALGVDYTVDAAAGILTRLAGGGIADRATAVIGYRWLDPAKVTLSDAIGGIDANNGKYLGVQALLAAQSIVKLRPRILLAPYFTHQRPVGVREIVVTGNGSGYAVPPTVAITGGGGTGATARAILVDGVVTRVIVERPGRDYAGVPAVILTTGSGAAATATVGDGAVTGVAVTDGGAHYAAAPDVVFEGAGTGAAGVAVLTDGVVTAVTVTHAGSGYTAAPAVRFVAPAGGGATAVALTGPVKNPVMAELQGIAQRLRAVVLADGPNATDEAAVDYREDFGDPRVYVVDPWVLVWDTAADEAVPQPASPRVAGLIARSDEQRGFWWSPSNQEIAGIVGTTRAVDFALGDPDARANDLNAHEVATIIHQDGYRLWRNRTTALDPRWAFLSVRRVFDVVEDSIQQAHLWAVDRNIDRLYFEHVVEGVNAFLRHLKTLGAIIDGRCWADPKRNPPDQIAQGKTVFGIEITPSYPAETVTFEVELTNAYLTELFAAAA